MNIETLIKGEIGQEDLLNYYNVSLSYQELPKGINGLVFNYDDINFIIINKYISYYKRKKALIHELAHIELNQLCQMDKDLLAFHMNEYEDEADLYIKKIKEGLKI